MNLICSPTADTFFRPIVGQSVDEVTRLVEKHQMSVCVPQISARAPPVNSLTDAIQKIIILRGEFALNPYFQHAMEDRMAGCGRVIVVANHPL